MTSALVLIPVLVPLAGAAVALLARRSWTLQMLVGQLALLGSLLAVVGLLGRVARGGEATVFQLGGWAAPMGISFVADWLSAVFALMCTFVMVFGLLYARGSQEGSVRGPAFVPLFLCLSAGLNGGILTGDVFNFFVFAELLVISAAVLTALSDDENGVEAAWKYFYISTFAGILLLAASACFYAGFGTLNIADLTLAISERPGEPMLRAAAALLLAALLIKVAAVPFHFWQPDFYSVSPAAVGAMLSGVVVKLGVYGLIRFTTTLLLPLEAVILPGLLGLGVAGVIVGSLSAIGTRNARRLLAYSSMAQVGLILIALGTGTEAGLVAAVVFAVNHALIKSALMMLAGAVASRTRGNSAAFDEVSGAGRAVPLAGWLFVIGAMGLVGMPPTNGFVSKLLVLAAVAPEPVAGLSTATTVSTASGRGVGWVVGVCVASVLTMLYCFRAYSKIWWSPLPAGHATKPEGDDLTAPAALIATCLVLGLLPGALTTVARETAHSLQDPSRYLRAVLRSELPPPPSGADNTMRSAPATLP